MLKNVGDTCHVLTLPAAYAGASSLSSPLHHSLWHGGENQENTKPHEFR